jgi:hypothetical protein
MQTNLHLWSLLATRNRMLRTATILAALATPNCKTLTTKEINPSKDSYKLLDSRLIFNLAKLLSKRAATTFYWLRSHLESRVGLLKETHRKTYSYDSESNY